MISKIMSTPVASATNSYNNCTSPKKVISFKQNAGLGSDTVSFTANKVITLEDAVNNLFSKLAISRNKNHLGFYSFSSKTDGVNVYAQETKYGKEAILTLTNSLFDGKKYASFDIKRVFDKNIEVKDLDHNLKQDIAQKVVKAYLEEIV